MSMNFSVLMSVYKNDKPELVRSAIESVSINQTVKPDEVFIVVDGPVPETLSKELCQLQEEIQSLRIEWCKENRGLGLALQYGLERVKYDTVARMDSDDISLPNRFELQLAAFEDDKELSIVGGQITEFIDYPSNIVGARDCPLSDVALKKFMKARCGFNHMTVMFKKNEVLRAGNYQPWHFNEDYYLWIRMMLAGCKFANLPDTLVNVRVGKEMYARRSGWKYFKSEEGIQRYMWKYKLISFPHYVLNTCIRFGVQVAVPNKVRGWMYQKIFRK